MRLLLLLPLLFLPGMASAQYYLVGFEQSMDKCQAALETSEGFSDEGLIPVPINNQNTPFGITDPEVWRVPGSAFEIFHGFFEDPSGQRPGQRSSICTISPMDKDKPLTSGQLEAVYDNFTARMQRQITDGSHKRRDPVDIPNSISVAYGPLKPGPHGYPVAISLNIDPDGMFGVMMMETKKITLQPTGNVTLSHLADGCPGQNG